MKTHIFRCLKPWRYAIRLHFLTCGKSNLCVERTKKKIMAGLHVLKPPSHRNYSESLKTNPTKQARKYWPLFQTDACHKGNEMGSSSAGFLRKPPTSDVNMTSSKVSHPFCSYSISQYQLRHVKVYAVLISKCKTSSSVTLSLKLFAFIPVGLQSKFSLYNKKLIPWLNTISRTYTQL